MNSSKSLSVKMIDYSQFKNMHTEWSDLLNRSMADNLFMSWAWHYCWWETFGKNQGLELLIVAVYDNNQLLLGLAPLYIQNENRYGIKIRRLQFLGNMWRHTDNIRSEYIDFIIDKSKDSQILDILLNTICKNIKWDEFVITNYWLKSDSINIIKKTIGKHKYLLRITEKGRTHKIDTNGSFEEYLSSLSAKSRAKLYNQRNKLLSHGNIKREKATETTINEYFDLLNMFHRKRWDKNVFEGKRLEFHKKLARYAIKEKLLDFEKLIVDDTPISILYDFNVGNKKYGYQLGFNEKYDKRISVSQLHFGYSIESAFKNNLSEYDFLRGFGKSKTAYKNSITVPYKETATLQIIRTKPLKILYRLYDKIKNPDITK